MAGVKEAKAGLLSFNPLALAAGLALGGLVVAGIDAIKISREHFKAQENLNAAIAHSARVISPTIAATKAHAKALADLAAMQRGTYIPATHLSQLEVMRLQDAEARVAATTGQARINAQRRLAELQVEYAGKVHGASVQVGNLAAAQKRVSDTAAAMGKNIKIAGVNQKVVEDSLAQFMQTNRDFISNQNDVINSYAALVREGVKAKDLSRLMTIALNIQAVEGGTLADAVSKVQQAEVGRNRGLATAVGLTLQAVPASASYAEKQKIIAYNLRQVERAYKDGTKAVDPLTRETNKLKTSWENIAEIAGPELIGVLSGIAKGASDFLDMLKDPKSYTGISDRLTKIASGFRAIALQLGIAEETPSEKASHTPRKPGDLSGLTPAQRAAYIKAFPQYSPANLAKEAAASARITAAAQAKLDKANAEMLAYLKSIAQDSRTQAMNSRNPVPVTVVLNAAQVANQIRISERRLR